MHGDQPRLRRRWMPAAVRPAPRSSGNTDTQAASAHCAVCVSVLPPDRCRAQRAHRREMRVISLRVTPPLRVLVPFLSVVILSSRGEKKKVCGSCGKRVLCVFQGAVDAFWASTAPAASTDWREFRRTIVSELGHLAGSAIRAPRFERHAETCAPARWTVSDIQWEVARRAPVQG